MYKHLVKSTGLVFLALLASTSCAKKASEDEKVIETVLSAIKADFAKAGSPLKFNQVILVESKWSSPKRSSFSDGLKDLEEEAARTKDRTSVSEISSALHRPSSWSPPAPVSPMSMALGSNVVVGEMEGSWRSEGHHIKGASSWLTAIADYDLEPPGYSPDGNYAVLRGSFPWSMHSGVIRFFLKKVGTGWSVIRKVEIFYV